MATSYLKFTTSYFVNFICFGSPKFAISDLILIAFGDTYQSTDIISFSGTQGELNQDKNKRFRSGRSKNL